jgi:hypothetical protein
MLSLVDVEQRKHKVVSLTGLRPLGLSPPETSQQADFHALAVRSELLGHSVFALTFCQLQSQTEPTLLTWHGGHSSLLRAEHSLSFFHKHSSNGSELLGACQQ